MRVQALTSERVLGRLDGVRGEGPRTLVAGILGRMEGGNTEKGRGGRDSVVLFYGRSRVFGSFVAITDAVGINSSVYDFQ